MFKKNEILMLEKEEIESTLGNLKMIFDQEKGKLIEVIFILLF